MVPGLARAADAVVHAADAHVSLTGHLKVLADPDRAWSIREVLAAPLSDRFVDAAGERFSLAAVSGAVWARVDVVNPSDTIIERDLALDQIYYRRLDFYEVDPDGVLRERHLAAGAERRDVDRTWLTPVFRLRLAPGTTRILIRYDHDLVTLGLHLRTTAAQAEFEATLIALYAGITAALTIILMSAIAFMVSTSTRRHLPFAAFIASALWVDLCGIGAPRYMVGEALGSYGWLYGPIELSAIAIIWFTRRFLELERQMRRVDLGLRALQVWLAVQFCLGFVDGPLRSLIGPLSLLPFLVLSSIALAHLIPRSREALMFGLGLLPFYFAGTMGTFTANGWIESSVTNNLLVLGPQALAACVFALGVGMQVGREINEARVQLVAHQAALIESNERLERTVEQRTRRLRDAQNQLVQQEKMASLGQLVAGIAHEINTPVGVALTITSQLEREHRALSAQFEARAMTREGLRHFLDQEAEGFSIVLANIARAAELVRSFKQVAADQASEAPRTVDLGAYVQDVLRNVQPILRSANIKLTTDLAEGIETRIQCGALAQVITNLVQNAAIHAFGDKPDRELGVSLGRDETSRLVLRVKDNGLGMPDEVKQKAFDPFFTTKRDSGGTGLGLYIVHNLVTGALGGALSLESRRGHGTEFAIVLSPGGPP